MSKKPSKALQAVAYHEAGHVVAAYLLRIDILSVTIAPAGDYLGAARNGKMIGGDLSIRCGYKKDRRAIAWVERFVQMLFAGPVAENQFSGRWNYVGAGQDYMNAADLASHVCYDEGELSAYLQLLKIRSRLLITQERNWLAVEALAAALLEKKTLSKKAFRKVIGSVLLSDRDAA